MSSGSFKSISIKLPTWVDMTEKPTNQPTDSRAHTSDTHTYIYRYIHKLKHKLPRSRVGSFQILCYAVSIYIECLSIYCASQYT